jgi:FAD/FMN-containing dehydrogenase
MVNLNLQDRQDGSRDGLFLLLTFLERSGTERSTMTGSSYEQVLKTLEKTFKNRIRRPSGETEARSGALASVLPLHAQEVELLAREVARYSMPLAAVGGTSPEPVGEEGKLLVRFDLMRGVRLPYRGGGWAEAEPGTPWLKLEEELRLRDMGLAVYPTSAPRATVGAWLATDGLGVGFFEFGWLRENVLSASVVLPVADRSFHDCVIRSNDVSGFEEEGISLDPNGGERGNDAASTV